MQVPSKEKGSSVEKQALSFKIHKYKGLHMCKMTFCAKIYTIENKNQGNSSHTLLFPVEKGDECYVMGYTHALFLFR